VEEVVVVVDAVLVGANANTALLYPEKTTKRADVVNFMLISIISTGYQ
jgi:hypothetical protein